jgi:adenosylcobinamide kinase/adenosylcobinamide-phosphate guanylyltransferase
VGRLLFVLGGARSGKSRYAQARGAEAAGPDGVVAFIATAEGRDPEMRERIRRHRQSRPAGWTTLEAPRAAAKALRAAAKALREAGPAAAVLVDCLTLLMSNLLLEAADARTGEQAVLGEIHELLAAAREAPGLVILVSNEVGQGVVPESELGRAFRDIAGRAHQLVAAEADEVVFLTAGIPQKLK